MPVKINKVKKCIECSSRLSGKHHFFCDNCWNKRHREKLKKKTIDRIKNIK